MLRAKAERLLQSGFFPPLLLGWLLLPVLFQTLMGFQSGARWAWEGAYLLLTLLLCAGLYRVRADRGGWWCALLAPAAALGGVFAQNALLGGALAVLAAVLLVKGRPPLALRLLAGAALVPLCACALLALLVLPMRGTARRVVADPDGGPRQYAEVTIVDPGAMGRVRYHAVEQYGLLELDPLLRLSVVTGRDSAPSGQGKYGWLVDAYFES